MVAAHWTMCIYFSDTQIWSNQNKATTPKNHWKTLNHRKKGELWQPRSTEKSGNHSATAMEDLTKFCFDKCRHLGVRHQVPKYMWRLRWIFSDPLAKYQRHFYYDITKSYEIISTIQYRISKCGKSMMHFTLWFFVVFAVPNLPVNQNFPPKLLFISLIPWAGPNFRLCSWQRVIMVAARWEENCLQGFFNFFIHLLFQLTLNTWYTCLCSIIQDQDLNDWYDKSGQSTHQTLIMPNKNESSNWVIWNSPNSCWGCTLWLF